MASESGMARRERCPNLALEGQTSTTVRVQASGFRVPWSRPWKKQYILLGISTYNGNPEPEEVLK